MIVFLLADGMRLDLLRELMAGGRLPNLEALVREGSLCTATSTFPTTTGPAHLPFITGRFAGECEIPGIRWVDKSRGWFSRTYVSLLANGKMDRDLRGDVETVFQHAPSACIFSHITRGARLKVPPFGHFFSHALNTWLEFDSLGMRLTRRCCTRGYALVFTLLSGIDEFSHRYGCRSKQTFAAYQLVDRWVGRLRRYLGALGVEHEIIIASDHGMSDTGVHIDLVGKVRRMGYTTGSYPLSLRKGEVFVAESGNSMAHLYFRDESRAPEVAERLCRLRGVDLVLVRTGGEVEVRRGSESAHITSEGERCRYEATEGDPLGVGEYEGRWMDRDEWHAATLSTEYPDSVVQIAQVFGSRRCGDVVVTARCGYDLRTLEVPEHRASHGSLRREHMLVPVLSTSPLRVRRTTDLYWHMVERLRAWHQQGRGSSCTSSPRESCG